MRFGASGRETNYLLSPEEVLEMCKQALSERLGEASKNWVFVLAAELPDGIHVKSSASNLAADKGAKMLTAINQALAKVPARFKPV